MLQNEKIYIAIKVAIEIIASLLTVSLILFVIFSLFAPSLSQAAKLMFEIIPTPITSMSWLGLSQVLTPSLIVLYVFTSFLKNSKLRRALFFLLSVLWCLLGYISLVGAY